tara:strand:- start:145 stop:714 length:570 start_codon:yes stop_codon:yes gene_type:complete
MSDDSFLLELKDASKIDGKVNYKILRETYYLSIKAGLTDALCMFCHVPIDNEEEAIKFSNIKLYCSDKCKEEMKASLKPEIDMRKHCVHCGVVFYAQNKHQLARKQYCRRQCSEEAHNKRKLIDRMKGYQNFNSIRDRVERNMKTWKQGKGIECLECGKLFIGKSHKKFCCDQPCGQTYRRRQKKNGLR